MSSFCGFCDTQSGTQRVCSFCLFFGGRRRLRNSTAKKEKSATNWPKSWPCESWGKACAIERVLMNIFKCVLVFFHFTVCISCSAGSKRSGCTVLICSVLKFIVSFQHVCGSLCTKRWAFVWNSQEWHERCKPVLWYEWIYFPQLYKGIKEKRYHCVILLNYST